MVDLSPIQSIAVAGGRVGMVPCPGRQDLGPRSLRPDVEALREWGASQVLTLIEPHELLVLGVPSLRTELRAAGLLSHHLPVTDMAAPDHRFEAGWPRVRAALLAALGQGGRVVVHCRGGLGRTGAVVARLLVELGDPPERAIDAVRTARPGAIETPAQERWVVQSVAGT